MTLDRWRGRRGILGWLVLTWDVWHVRRFARRHGMDLTIDIRRRADPRGENRK